jgi:hypothetical protein
MFTAEPITDMILLPNAVPSDGWNEPLSAISNGQIELYNLTSVDGVYCIATLLLYKVKGTPCPG